MTDTPEYDVLIVGGGINGAGIARDAADRGLSVLLCEQVDLAGHTSSASTKLIHGGLRYLEHYEFGLVRKALHERDVLLGIAPHIIWPLRFVLPHVRELRPAWMIRAGLFLYDRLGGRTRLPASRGIRLHDHPAGQALNADLDRAFLYSDCWVQDARLVVLNAMDAAMHGAAIRPRTRCIAARRDASGWSVTLEPTGDGDPYQIRARALVNAAGPWVSRFLREVADAGSERAVQLVKGSHIVVPKWFDHDDAYIFQHTDGRVIFAIPYERDFTLIGTTDTPCPDDPADTSASAEEIEYLCNAVNRYFAHPVRPNDIVWSYAGVRALDDDDASGETAALSRDYSLALDTAAAPLLSVFGGKLTTYRQLAREALDRLAPLLGNRQPCRTATSPLPGGDIPDADFNGFLAGLRQRHPWLPDALAWRLARNYGTRGERIIGTARALDQLGEHFGADLYEAELRYLVEQEWAMSAADVLWRRSKLGLVIGAGTASRIDTWIDAYRQAHARTASNAADPTT